MKVLPYKGLTVHRVVLLILTCPSVLIGFPFSSLCVCVCVWLYFSKYHKPSKLEGMTSRLPVKTGNLSFFCTRSSVFCSGSLWSYDRSLIVFCLGEIDRGDYQSLSQAAVGQLGPYHLIYEPLHVINFDR